jgi:hypothetical protein
LEVVVVKVLRDRGLIDFMMAFDDDLELKTEFRSTVVKDEDARIEKMVLHLLEHECTTPQPRVYAAFPQFIAELFSALTRSEHNDWVRGHIAKLQVEEKHRLVWEKFEKRKVALYRAGPCTHR